MELVSGLILRGFTWIPSYQELNEGYLETYLPKAKLNLPDQLFINIQQRLPIYPTILETHSVKLIDVRALIWGTNHLVNIHRSVNATISKVLSVLPLRRLRKRQH